MKTTKLFLSLMLAVLCLNAFAAELTRTVDPLILPEWHQTNPWNGRCPGTGVNRAHAGSHALALAKTMKYWAYPTYGTGSVSYVDDDYGTLTQSFTADINWSGMSNTLVFQTTLRFIYMVGVAAYTNYEVDYSTSSLANVQSALINHFSYAGNIMLRNRSDFSNFYWKSMIREELDASRPVIYAATVSSGAEVAFIIDGYNDDGLFHINWSDVNYPNSWVDLNSLSVWGQEISMNNQHMLTGVMPSLGPDNIDENFETDFSNFNWQFAGHQNWTISSEAAFYGSQSAKSGNINDNQTTSMFIQINVTNPDTISFFKKVSCESEPNNAYDHLAFLIDNVEQERWSGDGSWGYHEYPVTPGVHDFRWTYSKDGASTYYGDCAWVDAIDFPEGTTPLNAPLFVEAEVVNSNQITLNWQAPPGVNPTLIGYKIFRNGVNIAQFNNPTMNTYNEFNMPNGDYTYNLRAVYTEGFSNPSNSTTVTVEVPYAPTNLTAALTGVNTAHLEWVSPPLIRDRALFGFLIYRDDVVVAEVENPLATDYDDTGLELGVYYYQVSALYLVGESARSNVALVAVGVPEPPGNLHATVVGSTVNLTWTQVSDVTFLTGFKVFRNGALAATVTSPTQLGYSDTNLLNGAYSYYVRAVYTDTDSGNSTTVNVIVEVAYPPTNVIATVTGDDVQLSWTNPIAVRSLTHYYVYRNNLVIAAVFNPSTTVYQDLNLPNGTYTYNVTAFYSGVESPMSATATALVEVLYPPRSLTASVSLADVHLNWMMPVTSGGLTRSLNGYNIYRNGSLVHFVSPGTITNYTDTGVPNGTYTYAVTALYSTGESTPVSVANLIVEVLYPVTVITHQVSDDDVLVSWQAAATSPTGRNTDTRAFIGYNVYKEGALVSTTTELSYADNNLANGVYHYYVKVLYAGGESISSPVVTATVEVLYPPRNLLATVTVNDIQLIWMAPATSGGLNRSFLGYRVLRNGIAIANPTIPAYTDTNLPNGQYDYQVLARYSSGLSAPTELASVIVEVLYPPNQLVRTVSNHNDVSLTWQLPIRTVLGYQVYRNDVMIAETQQLSYNDNSLADGYYTYAIKAVYSTGTSLASNPVLAFIQYPYPPQNLAATAILDDVTLSWQPVAGTNVLYHIYRGGTLIGSTSYTPYIDNNLANGSYSYYITTSNASDSGVSDPSATVTAEVSVMYPPQTLSGSVIGDDVTLNWLAPGTGPRELLGYKVYRNGSFLANANVTTYQDNNLPNADYSYYVTAVYNNGESAGSNVVNLMVEVMYPPTGLTSNVIDDDVYLVWTAAATSRAIQGYKVYRDGAEIAQTLLPAYTDNNLANGVYSYYVKAVYIHGLSEPTASVQAIVEVLYPPSGLSYSTFDDDILLSWQAAAVSGNNRSVLGYKIYRNGSYLTQVTGLNYTDASLANGSYQYYVRTLYSSGESLPSNTVNVILEVLYPVTNLSYTVSGDDVSLTWNLPATSGGLRNLLGYKVLRDGVVITQVSNLSYTDNNLANGIYTYAIVAVYDSGEALPSASVEVLVEVLYPASNLSFLVIADAVNLTWSAAPNSARALTGYKIYRNGSVINTVNVLSYSDTALANGSYSYYVTAVYGTGESVPSNTVNAVVEVLYPVTNLSYTVSGDDVSLSWILPATSGGLRNLLGYKVLRDGVVITQVSSLSYTDNNLANGIYSYAIQVVYSSGVSTTSPSVEVLVEVLYPASNLSYQVLADAVHLSWNPAPNSARSLLGYKVYRGSALLDTVTGLSYNDVGLANGSYSYYVTAIYGTGESVPSNTVTAIVEVLYPATELSYTVNQDDVSLTWVAAVNSGGLRSFLGYAIYRNGAMIHQTTALNYTDTNLANGLLEYYVKAVYSSGQSAASNIVTALVEVLYPPTQLAYSVNGANISLTWLVPVNIGGLRALQGYTVYRDGTMLSTTVNNYYTDNNLANGSYHYYVIANYGTGDSTPSNAIDALVNVLYPPSGLSLTVVADDVHLTWQAAPNAPRTLLYYQLYRNWLPLSQTTQLEYSDLNLANGNYSYFVSAVYQSGESAYSNTAGAFVEVAYPASQLSATVSEDTVTLSWVLPPTGPTRALGGYFIYRNNSIVHVMNNPNQTSWTEYGLANGDYSYYVVAVYNNGLAVPSNTVNVSVFVMPSLIPPSNLTAVLSGTRNVILNWQAPAVPVLAYKIFRNNVEIYTTTATTYTNLNLPNGSYAYYIKAQYAEGLSSASNTATVNIMMANPPTQVYAQVVSGNTVEVSWSSPNQAEIGFIIYRNGIEIGYVGDPAAHIYTNINVPNGSWIYSVAAVYENVISNPAGNASVSVQVAYSPTNLTIYSEGNTAFLSWVAPSDEGGLIAYRVYRNGMFLVQVNSLGYSNAGLVNGTYSYQVKALYAVGESLPTPVTSVDIIVAYPPSGLSASVNGTNVLLTWSSPTDLFGFQSYQIWRDGNLINSSNQTSFTDTAVPNGNHSYHVVSQYSSGISIASNTATANVFYAHVPTGLALLVLNGNDVLVTWDALNQMQTGYLIYRDGVLQTITGSLEYTDDNLTNGTHSYQIAARYPGVDSALSPAVSANILVAYQPQNLAAVTTNSRISLSWNAPSDIFGLTNYRVYRFLNGVPNGDFLVSSTYYTMYNLPNGSYSFNVKAIYGTLVSAPSNTATAEVIVAYSPSNLSAATSGSSVNLSWDAPSDTYGLLNYHVFRAGIDIGSSTVPTYTDTALPNGNHNYYVTAVYSTGSSAASNTVQAHVAFAYPPQTAAITLNNDDITVTWAAPMDTGDFTQYRVFRGETLLAQTNALTYTDYNLSNADYAYYVQSQYGTDNYSAMVSAGIAHVEIHYLPTNLNVSIIGSAVHAAWNAPSDQGFLLSYNLYRDGSLVGNTTALNYSDLSAANGSHQYRVSAVYLNGESALTNAAVITIINAYPPQNVAYQTANGIVALTWDAPVDVLGLTNYKLLRDGVQIAATPSQTYTDSGLPNGNYTYTVLAFYSSGANASAEPVTISVVSPFPPQNFSASAAGSSAILHWNAPVDAFGLTAYRIYRDDVIIAEPQQNEWTDENLINGAYTYQVSALYGDAESVHSSALEVSVFVAHAVGSVTAIEHDNRFTITWQAPLNGSLPNYYKVWFLEDGMQNTPEQWIFIADVHGSLSVEDQMHAGYPEGNYLWAVVAMYDPAQSSAVFSNILAVSTLAPAATKLMGNFPNPFNPDTHVVFQLSITSAVELSVYNSRGQLVRKLVKSSYAPGEYSILWDGKDDNGRIVASGIYFSRLKAGHYDKTSKMALVK